MRISRSRSLNAISGSSPLVPTSPRAMLVHPRAAVIEQALVDVPDLFHVEVEITQSAGFGDAALPERQHLQRVQHRQRRAVVHGNWRRIEKRVARWIEQAPAVGRQPKAIVIDAAMHRPERGKQTVPCRVPLLEGVDAVAHGVALELLASGQHRVRRCVDGIVGGQQPPFLGGQQHDETHHHRDGSVVDLTWRNPREELPAG